jgi:UDP-N-acetylglucosamine--dolichyl-phosphate N-acetylglucosaminephosphotransferase
MDPKIWEESNRHTFPWSLNLRKVFQLAVLIICLAAVLPVGPKMLLTDYSFIKLLGITLTISSAAYIWTDKSIDSFKDTLCSKNMFGKDLNKLGDQATKEKVPEGLGIVPAIIFLLVTIHEQIFLELAKDKLVEYNAALLSICLCILLGFIDDVVDLRWRHKMIVSTISTFPLLVAY